MVVVLWQEGLQVVESCDVICQCFFNMVLNYYCDLQLDFGKWVGFELYCDVIVIEEFMLGFGIFVVNVELWDEVLVDCFRLQFGMKVMGFVVKIVDDYCLVYKIGFDVVFVDLLLVV